MPLLSTHARGPTDIGGDRMIIHALLRETNTPAQNSLAWETAMNAVPPDGAVVVLLPGMLQHEGLVLSGKSNVTIVGGGGDYAKSSRTRLVCVDPSKHGMIVDGCRSVTLTGFFS